MKRKKEVEMVEADEIIQDEVNQKKARSGSGQSASTQIDAESDVDVMVTKRMPSRRELGLVEDVQDSSHFQEESGGSEEAESEAGAAEERLEITPKKGPGRPKGSRNGGFANGTPQKRLLGKGLFSTPVKTEEPSEPNGTPRIERNADRSARRKSTRTLIERTVLGNTSDNEEEEEGIAQHIYDSEEDELAGHGNELEDISELPKAPDTPSKKRGRPKGSKNRRSTSPPLTRDLPPHEKYFLQNRGGRAKTSNNNLSGLKLLDHEEYFTVSRKMTDRHASGLDQLQSMYAESFNQWHFEIQQDFNLCIYGWGSKRSLLMKFADYIYNSQVDHAKAKIVVINGYVPALTIRDVLSTVAAAVSESGHKLGSQPAEMLETLLSLLEEDEAQDVTLIIHSIDRVPLRRPATQTLLSRLSSHPQVHLVASADHPSFPLLWDSSLRSTYNFLFHDCTTFQPYNAELDVVVEVHELLGRSGRRVGGKEGVIFVLKSLPENAKNLFRMLIGEQLAAMDDTYMAPSEDEDDNDHDNEQRIGTIKKREGGVEYRLLYQKAVEEFICSNEMNLRTLLKEFHDHQMIQSKKDALGTEFLIVPFRREELGAILEDLSS